MKTGHYLEPLTSEDVKLLGSTERDTEVLKKMVNMCYT